jgi:hypothetical protein
LRLPGGKTLTSAEADGQPRSVAADRETIDLSGLSGHVVVRAKVGS